MTIPKTKRTHRCTGKVSIGMGMHERCILSARHRGPCSASKHESIPYCDGSGREACVVCSEEADKCVPFPCGKENQ